MVPRHRARAGEHSARPECRTRSRGCRLPRTARCRRGHQHRECGGQHDETYDRSLASHGVLPCPAGLNASWPYLVPPRTVAARYCGWGQPVRLLPTKARGMEDGERINEGRFPHLRSRVALTVEVGLHHRTRVTPEAPRRPSDHRVAFHQPYQDRHTGRT